MPVSTATLLLLMTIKPNWILTFSQEFDGPSGQPPDPKVWARDLGGGGFGNGEWQSYTDGNANAFLDGQGNLVIEARKETVKGKDGIERSYSSARLKTQGSFSQRYGRFEARIKLPRGKGIWPAFWMMGDSIARVGWPACGEIDVMEFLGHQTKITYGTLHGPGYAGNQGKQGRKNVESPLCDDFHVYGIEWDSSGIKWTFDGEVFHKVSPENVGAADWPFDQPFFMILNLAVGGGWPGYPDETTTFPQRLVVDWVRVYKDGNLEVDDQALRKAHRQRQLQNQEYKGPRVFTLPSDIPAVDFLPGGYKDNDPQNIGGAYRPLEGVDIGRSGLDAPKYAVGWTKPGEWLEYDVLVRKDGRYRLALEAASEGPGGEFRFELNGKPLTGNVKVTDTAGWDRWNLFDAGVATLQKGRHRLRLCLVRGGGTHNTVANLLRIKVSATAT